MTTTNEAAEARVAGSDGTGCGDREMSERMAFVEANPNFPSDEWRRRFQANIEREAATAFVAMQLLDTMLLNPPSEGSDQPRRCVVEWCKDDATKGRYCGFHGRDGQPIPTRPDPVSPWD
jgi:hypothetical protein